MARLSDCKKYCKVSIDTFTACPIGNEPRYEKIRFRGF